MATGPLQFQTPGIYNLPQPSSFPEKLENMVQVVWTWFQMFSKFMGCLAQVSGKTPKRTPVKVLLPHEVLHCLASCCSPHAFSSILLGNLEGTARRRFFEHIKSLDAWGDHPVLCQDGIDYESLIPITLHCDGAQFYRDDENFVWSFGSAFGSSGFIKDVLLIKFPMAIIPERFMQDHAVSG